MARAKLGIDRSSIMKSVHAACRARIPGELIYGKVTITLPDGRVKEYTKRFIVRDRQKYMSCVAEEIRRQLDEAAKRVPGVRTK